MNLIEKLREAIIEGDEEVAVQIANQIIEEKIDLKKAILNGLSDGMKEVGRKYEQHEYFIPEIIISADALNSAFEIFKPYLEEIEKDYKANVVIGVVKGDIHDIGKNIVTQFLKTSGYNVIDLGRNVHSDKFIEEIESKNANILCLSTLMTPTLDEMKLIIDKLRQKKIKDKIKVIIGGAPTDQSFMKEIGADFYCKDALEAIKLLDDLFPRKNTPKK